MVEEVEAFQPDQQACALRQPDPVLNKDRHFDVGAPRNADLLITAPLITGRSLVAPSPLLSTPVVALNGRAEAIIASVPAVKFHGN